MTGPSLAAASVHSLLSKRFADRSALHQAIREIGSMLGVAITVALLGNARGGDAAVPQGDIPIAAEGSLGGLG